MVAIESNIKQNEFIFLFCFFFDFILGIPFSGAVLYFFKILN